MHPETEDEMAQMPLFTLHASVLGTAAGHGRTLTMFVGSGIAVLTSKTACTLYHF